MDPHVVTALVNSFEPHALDLSKVRRLDMMRACASRVHTSTPPMYHSLDSEQVSEANDPNALADVAAAFAAAKELLNIMPRMDPVTVSSHETVAAVIASCVCAWNIHSCLRGARDVTGRRKWHWESRTKNW